MAPSAGVGRKLISASRMSRTPHAGCHSSGWCAEKERQTFTPVSKRPDGVRKTMFGGLKGYSGGRSIRPWYTPPAKSVPSAPRIVKCHSNMSCSRGAAWYWSEGSMESSRMSALMRRSEGDLLMVVALVDIGVILFSGFSVLVSCIVFDDVVRKRTKQGVNSKYADLLGTLKCRICDRKLLLLCIRISSPC